MPPPESSQIFVVAINLLVVATLAAAYFALLRARRNPMPVRVLQLVLLSVLVIGLANAFAPPLAALRLRVPPAQPAMVAGMTALFLLAGFSTAGRRFFATADLRPLIAFNGWRIAFGALLLAAGLAGGLPANFFVSVAAGDILAGIWALSIGRRGQAAPGEVVVWNMFGLADLLHALPLAMIYLPPFFAAHPGLAPPILLPLLGVPLLIALHVLMLNRLLRRPLPIAKGDHA